MRCYPDMRRGWATGKFNGESIFGGHNLWFLDCLNGHILNDMMSFAHKCSMLVL